MTFGKRLRALRKSKGYRQGELANRIGIKQSILSLYELDKMQPTLERIEWFCVALNVTATELLGF